MARSGEFDSARLAPSASASRTELRADKDSERSWATVQRWLPSSSSRHKPSASRIHSDTSESGAASVPGGVNCAAQGFSRKRVLGALQSHAPSEGASLICLWADLGDPEGPKQIVDKTVAAFGRLDILVNCAATRTAHKFDEITPDAWDLVDHVTARAAFLCSQRAAPHLVRARGTIINMSSTAAFRPFGRNHHYVAAKAALDGLTRSLALELAPQVTVNSVCPGIVGSSLRTRPLRKKIPMKRFATPQEVATCVLFLAREGRYITGQSIVIDGGLTLGPGTGEWE